MKQTIFIFLFLIYSTLSAQIDSSGNFAEIDFPDLNYKIDISKTKNFLFTDSLFRFPNYGSLPSSISPIENREKEKLFHVSSINSFDERLNIYQIGHSETFLFYQIGSANSQNLFLKHIQRINSHFFAIAEYSRNKSDGFYLRQNGKSEYVNFHLNYQKHLRYTLQPYFHYKNINYQENGGIKSDSLFQTGEFSSSLILENNLNTASNSKTDIQSGIFQKIVSKSKLFRFYSDIGYSLHKRNFIYEASDSYYDNLYLDTISTNDNYTTEKFYNEIKIFFLTKKIVNRVGVKNEFLRYQQNTFDTTSFENKIFIQSQALHWENTAIFLNFDYILTGFNSENFSSEIKYHRITSSIFSKIKFETKTRHQTPEILSFRMNGNHFQWNNNLEKTFFFENKIELESKFGQLNVKHEMIKNYVFLNENIEVIQFNEDIQRVEINYHFLFERKKIYWRNDFIYQNVFSGNDVYRVPTLSLRSDLRFKSKLKAMDLQLGIVANYRTSYYANGYDPALTSFYLQNELKTGNYPILDFFIQSTIKTVDLKFTVAHFNSGLTGFNYYATPLYPIAPRAFYFGLSWHFKD